GPGTGAPAPGGPSNGFGPAGTGGFAGPPGTAGTGGFPAPPGAGTGGFASRPGNGFGGTGPAPVSPSPANGTHGTDGADAGVRIPEPPENGHHQRLPIFDSLESDWFRRSGGTPPNIPAPATGSGPQPVQAAAEPAAWHTSPADEGWRAAESVAAPTTGATTSAGLPKRVPRANLVPGSVGDPTAASSDTSGEPSRSAEEVRSRLASFQRGVRQARAAAPTTEEPQDG
ncbi:MAG TPA: hypothetical protein VGD68_07250, partial [Streptosporangiaceae bacterium]